LTEEDRRMLADTVAVMNGLRFDMQEFRGEMREFKQQSVVRISSLEHEQGECQKNPSVCATARLLESHIQGHKGGKSFAVSVWAVCVSSAMCLFTVIMSIVKRG